MKSPNNNQTKLYKEGILIIIKRPSAAIRLKENGGRESE